MKAFLLLMLQATATQPACDWVLSTRIDPMTDKKLCVVSSPTAKISFYKSGSDRPRPVTSSPYQKAGLNIRIDDNQAISFYDVTRALDQLLLQLETGTRIRTSFRDYPSNQAGDAAICTLPALLKSCDTTP